MHTCFCLCTGLCTCHVCVLENLTLLGLLQLKKWLGKNDRETDIITPLILCWYLSWLDKRFCSHLATLMENVSASPPPPPPPPQYFILLGGERHCEKLAQEHNTMTSARPRTYWSTMISTYSNVYLVVGELGVKEVEYSKTTKKLLLCLKPSLTRLGFLNNYMSSENAILCMVVK